MKLIIILSTNSLVVWPNTLDIIAMTSQPISENMVHMYQGGSLGMYCSSIMKVWNNQASLGEVIVGNLSSRYPIEMGVRIFPGCNCSISLMDSVVMVNNIVWLGVIIALWLGL